MILVFDAELWLWDARRHDSWTFVSLSPAAAEEVRARTGGVRRGFGSVKVRASIGPTTWSTSIFPASGPDGGYVLPVKAAVRRARALGVGDPVTVRLELLDG